MISHAPLVCFPSVPGPHVNIGGGSEGRGGEGGGGEGGGGIVGGGGEGGGEEMTHEPSYSVARVSKLSASGAMQPGIL